MSALKFLASQPQTMGVELELQLVNRLDHDLVRGASDLLALIARKPHPGEIKPEITESMVELSTGVHARHAPLLAELRELRGLLVAAGDRLNLGISGGGTHPFQRWSERRIFDTPRFKIVSDLYGYLAKQFTVFGQHVHIGCRDGDEALHLLHSLARYVPHFIALAASSPFYQGVDTSFDSARLNSISAFPLSGRAPYITRWDDFAGFFEKMRALGLVASMKDFYWDIRPKPEFGTVEVRVFDTPLTVERAAMIAAYAQALSHWLVEARPVEPREDDYLTYSTNRFQACRFGLDGEMVDARSGERRRIRDDIAATLDALAPSAKALETETVMAELKRGLTAGNDASWARRIHANGQSLNDLARMQAARWAGTG
jgi:carboxylate-amine ligase